MFINRLNYLHLFAKNLKEQRKKHRLTKRQIASLTGVTRKKQTLYERGDDFPSLKYVLQLSEAGFELSKLLGLSDKPCTNKQEQILLEIYRNASQETKAKIFYILLNQGVKCEDSFCMNHNAAFLVDNQSITNHQSQFITTVICLNPNDAEVLNSFDMPTRP